MAIYGAAAAAVLGLPHLITLHGGTYFRERWRRRALLGWACRRSYRVVAVSRSHARLIEQALHLPLDAVRVIPNGIVPTPLTGRDVRAELGLAPEALLVVAVGNLYPVKGYDVLLRALAGLVAHTDLPRWHLAIAGRGGEEPKLRSLAAELGLVGRVSFLGLRSDVGDLLASADLYALPSRAESHPLALLEAMFAGRPTVATAVGGVPDTVTDGREGLLVPPGEVAPLRDALARLLADPALRRQMGEAARQRAQREFTLTTMVDAYERLYTRE
jgi:glycosyltransferase involved in cell wall biosynthesis